MQNLTELCLSLPEGIVHNFFEGSKMNGGPVPSFLTLRCGLRQLTVCEMPDGGYGLEHAEAVGGDWTKKLKTHSLPNRFSLQQMGERVLDFIQPANLSELKSQVPHGFQADMGADGRGLAVYPQSGPNDSWNWVLLISQNPDGKTYTMQEGIVTKKGEVRVVDGLVQLDMPGVVEKTRAFTAPRVPREAFLRVASAARRRPRLQVHEAPDGQELTVTAGGGQGVVVNLQDLARSDDLATAQRAALKRIAQIRLL